MEQTGLEQKSVPMTLWRARARGHDAWWFFLLSPGRTPKGNWRDAECLDRWVLDRPVEAPAFTVLDDLRQWVFEEAKAGARPEPVEKEAGA